MVDASALRPFSRDEFGAASAVMGLAFHATGPQADWAVLADVLEFERTLGAFVGDEIIGTAALLSYELNVPGAVVPVGGVTVATVHPAHRRRGILSAMMDRQLADLHERGEA